MKVNPSFAVEMCPWFLRDMPGGDPNQQMRAFLNTECAEPLQPAKSDQEMQTAILGTMERLNMTIVAFGDPVI
ncbi:MAG: amidohydrolase, partial [Pedobacter sp.]